MLKPNTNLSINNNISKENIKNPKENNNKIRKIIFDKKKFQKYTKEKATININSEFENNKQPKFKLSNLAIISQPNSDKNSLIITPSPPTERIRKMRSPQIQQNKPNVVYYVPSFKKQGLEFKKDILLKHINNTKNIVNIKQSSEIQSLNTEEDKDTQHSLSKKDEEADEMIDSLNIVCETDRIMENKKLKNDLGIEEVIKTKEEKGLNRKNTNNSNNSILLSQPIKKAKIQRKNNEDFFSFDGKKII
jgi:hypothetical protein